MRFAPQSLGFLIAHEVRVGLRAAGGRRAAARKLWVVGLIALFPIAIGIGGAFAMRAMQPGPPGPGAVAAVTLVLAGLMLVMAPSAAVAVLRAFYERGDLDLLLSAPVPPARVLAAKTAGACLSVALPFLFLLGPFVIASAILARPGFALGVPLILVMAAVMTSIAFVVTRWLRQLLGPRQARVVVQVGAGLAGAAVFIGFQLQNIAPETARWLTRGIAHARIPQPLDWPARALFGDVPIFLLLAGIGALFALSALRMASGVLFDAPDTGGPRRRLIERRPVFRGGVTRSIIVKEFRLIGRDPELIAQVTLRLVFLIPALALLLRGSGGADAAAVAAARMAGAASALAGFLASSLAWLTVAAEDARELLGTAPVRVLPVFRAKIAAACLPPIALASAACLLVSRGDPRAAAVAILFACVSALGSALVQAWYAKPAARSAFKRRQRGTVVLGLAEIFMVGLWSTAAVLAVRGSAFALLPAGLAAALFYAAADARRTYRGALAIA
jgi:ABC-2 type transport system permease protein